ncbi:leucine-rich repeat domain-containing protein, partial [Porphyromonas sp. COT-108 OH1349]|uniref:leucine-rich repeat domain-containing protein n=1 Tax=Porphyromonas sp. COT-108 OH1349 TaxID=1537504 RepID=UPI00350F3A1E
RVRAEWKDNRLTILGDDVEEDLPSITLTTEKKVGEKIELSINAEPEDQADVWIDLNNNKVKDAGDSITEFDPPQEYTLGSQTVTVYGKVTELYCYSNSLTSLDVSKNTALTELSCYSNSLTSLDVSKNTALTVLDCSSNSLTSLDVSKNTALTELYCFSNSLTSLDVSKNTALTELRCYSNSLTSLDVSKNTELEWLICNSNSLTSLDVSKNTALTRLDCYSNSLTSLDVSKNTALTKLSCYSNFLTLLDVSKNTALTYLNCEENANLSSLKISSSINDELSVKSCKLSAETLNEIFRTLPDVKGQSFGRKKIWIANNPGTDACNKKIAKDKGWKLDVGDTPPAGYSMTMTTTKAVGEKIKLSINAEPEDQADVWIDLNNNKVKDAGESVTEFGSDKEYTLGSQTITVHGKVTDFRCRGEQLSSLDVSNNTALEQLFCYKN